MKQRMTILHYQIPKHSSLILHHPYQLNCETSTDIQSNLRMQSLLITHLIPLLARSSLRPDGSISLKRGWILFLKRASILKMECRRNGETTGFGVVSKGLLRAENAWTTLEPRPDSACLESAWPSFVSHNPRSYPSQLGVLLRGRGRVRSRLVGVEGWNTVVDCRACRHAANPGANVSFDVRGRKRVEESKYANLSSQFVFFFLFLLADFFLLILAACGFRDETTETFTCFCILFVTLYRKLGWDERHLTAIGKWESLELLMYISDARKYGRRSKIRNNSEDVKPSDRHKIVLFDEAPNLNTR